MTINDYMRRITLPGAGHFATEDAPEDVSAHILDLLSLGRPDTVSLRVPLSLKRHGGRTIEGVFAGSRGVVGVDPSVSRHHRGRHLMEEPVRANGQSWS